MKLYKTKEAEYQAKRYNKSRKRNQQFIQELREKATPEELIVRQWLIDNKIKHIFQKGFLNPFHRIVDFYIPKHKRAIEIDGGYHNNTKELDALKDKLWLQNRGVITIRITNQQVNSLSYIEILNILK